MMKQKWASARTSVRSWMSGLNGIRSRKHSQFRKQLSRSLQFEAIEARLLMAADLDDTLTEATVVGTITTSAKTQSASISPDVDVDMYRFTVTAGQVVDFDIDTPANGPGGLGSYLRLFNGQGVELASNNDGMAPGEDQVGYDAYLRYTFPTAGTYYIGVSNANNTNYDAVTGNGDVAGGSNSIGSYQLIFQGLPVDTDDALSEATVLGILTTTPKIVSDTIETDIDVDMYRFTVSKGQTVDFDIDTALNGPGGLGSYIRLFNAQGQQLDFNNDGAAPGEGQVGFDSYLRYTFAAAGNYFLGVSNYNNANYNPLTGNGDTAGGLYSIGDYQLTLQVVAPPPVDLDDAISEATVLGTLTTSPISTDASIDPDVDVDMYRFTVTAGQVVDFDIDTVLNGPNGLGSYLRLFNGSGQELASNNDGNAPGENTIGFDAYLRYTFATAGNYYIAVSNFNNILYDPVTGNGDTSGGQYTTGNYQLIVQALPVDPDDTLIDSTPLGAVVATPTTINASINPDIDVDIYRFTVTAGQVVGFDIDTALNGPGGLGSYLRLFDGQGNELAFNNDAAAPGESTVGFDAYLQYTFATAGTYYIAVSNANNTLYNPITGNGDTAGGFNSIGSYQLIIQGPTAPPADPDDTLLEATSLGSITTTPISTDASISPDVDVDMYRFTVTAGQVVDFDIDTPLNGPGGLGSFIRLFNATGQQLDFNNDGNAPGEDVIGFDSYLRHTFATAGTYYLGVSNFTNTTYDPVTGTGDISGGANATGSYLLTIAALPVDPDDTLVEANSLGNLSTTPSTFNGTIAPDIDVDMYRFTVSVGQIVDFDIDTPFNGPGGLGSFIRLFDSQGTELAFNNDAAAPDESQVGFDSYLRYTFTTAGTYFLGISNANNRLYDPVGGGGDNAGGQYTIGAYQLIVQLISAPPIDTDDSLSEATLLGAVTTSPNTTDASIAPDVDVDMYRFTVTAGQVVDFDIDTVLNGAGGLGSYIRLFNSTGQELANNNDGAAPGENVVGYDAYLRYTFVSAGTYYLGVSNFNNIKYDPVSGDGDTSGGLASIGAYQLTVQALPVDPDDAMSEANLLDTITTTPTTISGSILPDIDVDMYRFSVTAGQVVDFDIDTPLNGPGGLGSFIRLFNAQGQQLDFNNDAAAPGESAVGFDAYLRYTFAAAGNYYLGVSNANNILYDPLTGNGDAAGGLYSIGTYQLIVQTIAAPPNDPDDTLAKATIVGSVTTTPTSIEAGISPDIDVDMYRFSVTAGQVVDFDIDTPLNGPGGLGSFIRLFNAQGVELDSNNDGAAPGENQTGFDAYLRYTFPTAGNFYIGVSNINNTGYDAVTGNGDVSGGSNSTGTYQLIITGLPVDTDDAIAEATPLGSLTTTPITMDASIAPDIDVDMYQFSVTSGQVVDFDIDTPLNGPGGLGSYLRIFNGQGEQIDFNNDAAAPGEGQVGFDSYIRHTFSVGGTYYVGVSNFNNPLYDPATGNGDNAGGQYSIGSYQLILQVIAAPPNDPDDTLLEATLLGAISTTSSTINSSIAYDTDVNMVRFTVTAGQVVDFDIDTVLNGSGGLGSYLRLFDNTGKQLAFNDDGAAPGENIVGFDAYLRYTFDTAGTYYVGVSNFNNTLYDPVNGDGDTAGGLSSTGVYQLVIQALPVDPDDSLIDANILGALSTAPTTVNGLISPDIDVDIYRFNVTDNATVDFDIDTLANGPTGLGSYLRLFDAQGNQIDFNNDAAAPGESTLGFDAYLRHTFAKAGSYYIAVSNANNIFYDPVTGNGDTAAGLYSVGTYQLILQVIAVPPTDPDDTIGKASSLGVITATPVTVSASISPDTDVNMVSFTVTANQVVDFDIDTPLNGAGGLGSFIRLFNAQGDQLDFNNDGAAPGENTVGFDAYLRHTFAQAGTYYLGVSNVNNNSYDPVTGTGDVAGGSNATGTYSLIVQAIPPDPDDALSEAVDLGAVTTTLVAKDGEISTDIDVDMFQFTAASGDVVDFDIDTLLNGPGGLGSFLRLFNAAGQQIDFNNDAAAPGEGQVGYDAYLRHTFTLSGTYYVAVSNFNNTQYDAVTGNGDKAGGLDSIGAYRLNVQLISSHQDKLSLTINPPAIPEINGTATGTVIRDGTDLSKEVVVNLSSDSIADATVPATVVIPANEVSASFQITAVHNTTHGTTKVTITASSAGFTTDSHTLLISDQDLFWHNSTLNVDVSGDGKVTPLDALMVINYLNSSGSGPVPEGSPPPYYDVNADNFITPVDALIVINYLNSNGAGEGEGEASQDIATPTSAMNADSVDAVFVQFDESMLTSDAKKRK